MSLLSWWSIRQGRNAWCLALSFSASHKNDWRLVSGNREAANGSTAYFGHFPTTKVAKNSPVTGPNLNPLPFEVKNNKNILFKKIKKLQWSPDLVKFLGGAKIFTKSSFFTKSTVILLHNSSKMGGTKIFTKSRFFTIFTFTKSGLHCIFQKLWWHDS